MSTTSKAPTILKNTWHLFDAQGQTVGRIACRIADLLQGKHKPSYSQSLDVGDAVVVLNAAKVVFTGNKWQQKLYRRHSGYPGGLKEVPAYRMLEKHPTWIIKKAVYGMLPRNHTRRVRMERLHLYPGEEHSHQLQFPNFGKPQADKHGGPPVTHSQVEAPSPPPLPEHKRL